MGKLKEKSNQLEMGAVNEVPHDYYISAITSVSTPAYDIDWDYNFIVNGPSYSQISLTDYCNNGVCNANPKYGAPNDKYRAVEYCKTECMDREQNGAGCEGFFFQTHMNGHEICGFYADDMDSGTKVKHGHLNGAIVTLK